MSVGWAFLERLESLGALGEGPVSVLDLGDTPVYDADAAAVASFLGRRAGADAAAFAEWCADFAEGSGSDPATGARRNQSRLRQLSAPPGFEIVSLSAREDGAVDLEHDLLPDDLHGRFDLVLNLSASPAALNQMNVLRAVHRAAKAGGRMVHRVPISGFPGSGGLRYTPRFFCELAAWNGYELEDLWFDGPAPAEGPLPSLMDFVAYHPALERVRRRIEASPEEYAAAAAASPGVVMTVLLRKTRDGGFAGLRAPAKP